LEEPHHGGGLLYPRDEHRRDVSLRKLSIFSEPRNKACNDITVQNLRIANIKTTQSTCRPDMAGLGGNEFEKQLTRVRNYIEKKKTLTDDHL
jgi:hypothetical protein